MAGALNTHLHPISISSNLVKEKFSESVKFLGNVKTFIFLVNKSINYLLFRVYSTDELMIKADTTMAAARMERSETGHRFIIPRPRENSWGHRHPLNKERIIREFVGYTPIMNKKKDEECNDHVFTFSNSEWSPGSGLTPFKECLPRSAPQVDFLSIGLHSGAGWKYPSADTIHGI